MITLSLPLATTLSEFLLGLAFLIQSIEHFNDFTYEKIINVVKFILAIGLLSQTQVVFCEVGLVLIGILLLMRYQGPYNGGSDCISQLLLICLTASRLAPNPYWQEMALGYCACQSIYSYFQSGYAKIVYPEWRNGTALAEVFHLTAYPTSEATRAWGHSIQLMRLMSWSVIIFELLFPLAICNQLWLITFLIIAASFHIANAVLFGLNRFVWSWIATYPLILWLQIALIS